MTLQDLLEFGRAEWAARDADVAAVKSGAMTLELARKRIRKRASDAGLTPSVAHSAMCDAQRAGLKVSAQ